MLTNQPRAEQPNNDFFESLPVLPSRGSFDRTSALVRGHLVMCRDEGGESAVEGVMSLYEKQTSRDIIHEFRRLARLKFPEMSSKACAFFAHSPRVIRDFQEKARHVNFLLEIRDTQGWLTLSAHGLNRHISGPAFTHVQASFSTSPTFDACPLYSFDALREELLNIDQKGSRMVLGHKGSSFILREALQAMSSFQKVSHIEPSSIRQVRAAQVDVSSGAVFVDSSDHGAFRADIALVSERWHVAATPHRIIRSEIPSRTKGR
ncbi:MAG: hypothetical protein RL326_818 [Pseudomonadota bacterium]